MEWVVSEEAFSKEHIVQNGNKFMTGNGYMGFRGVMEEFRKSEFTCCNLAGVYDRYDGKWRETVNAPNGFYAVLLCGGREVSLLTQSSAKHRQCLDLKRGLHSRNTVFSMDNGEVTIRSERFVSLSNDHLMCMRFMVRFENACEAVIKTGIDTDVWEINGPHFADCQTSVCEGILSARARTGELGLTVTVSEAEKRTFDAEESVEQCPDGIFRFIRFHVEPNIEYTIDKFVTVFTSLDVSDAGKAALADARLAADAGYRSAFANHVTEWEKRWRTADVVIEGDEEAQLALRYSIYHLEIIAPRHSGRSSIAARGLSGQTYKGAVFWDTEMFMLPFFLHTDPDTARNLIRYRIETLNGARRKAKEYGYRGAFYAWESQETGDDACSDYNVTDVFTGRPVRTYFKDKQIHISADVAYAIWQACEFLGDDSILLNGGAEVILECARFYYSYAYYKEEKQRYELLDVIGPDEYHERVNNNAFTNKMAHHTFEAAYKCLEFLRLRYPSDYERLIQKIGYQEDLSAIESMVQKLYLPQPEPETGIIEQFDGYSELEDCTLSQVKSRLIHPKEYWGGSTGVASNTKIIKQADVLFMLYLFRNGYSSEIKRSNWLYYEPKTEHGSSLSPCIYALVACETGNPNWAYDYFMKSATIDLTGDSKQFAGLVYIGGTHPAASGGAWMVAVQGFAGLQVQDGRLQASPHLPDRWKRLAFHVVFRNERYLIEVTKSGASINKEQCS